jgi:hypothetical protein
VSKAGKTTPVVFFRHRANGGVELNHALPPIPSVSKARRERNKARKISRATHRNRRRHGRS